MTLPKTPRSIKTDLDSLLSSLIERGIADDQNFSILRRLSSEDWEVSFAGAEYISIASRDIDFADVYQELSDKRSYNAKLIDGALIQLLYHFVGDNLVKHRLAYFPSPNLKPFQDDPEAYLYDELYIDIISRKIVPFPLRFDFDIKSAKEIIHPHSHLTLGDFKCCRIPVSSPLTPRWFIEFILRSFYQTDSHDFVAGLPGHQIRFRQTITEKELSLIHVTIPC